MTEVQTVILYSSLFISLFFEVFLLITYLEVRGELKAEAELVNKPLVHFPTSTIIVPCFNEERTVTATVRSLLCLDYPKDKLSIILIDDGSTDDTYQALFKFKNHPQIKIFSKENGGKHTALNFALQHVTSDLVGCLDADSFVNRDALRKIVPFFEDQNTMAVTPSVRVHNPSSFLQYIQRVEYSWGIFLRRMLSSLGALYITPGPFSIFRTKVFHELGGYREGHSTEDMEIAMRMQKHHYKIVNSHSAHVYTVAPTKFKALYKQRVRWTYGFLNNVLDYREMFFNKNYGHIGLFILPIGTFSIFSSIYMMLRIIQNIVTRTTDFFIRLQSVGFSNAFQWPSFDWYFINTGTLPLLVIGILIITLVILYLALKLAEGQVKLDRGVFYYLFLYVFIIPAWLSRAVINTLFRRKVSWR